MPRPTERPVADGSVAPLLARVTIGAFRTWKEEGKRLGRTFPIPVVLFPNETTDQYEATFLHRTKPHPNTTGSDRSE